jgi:SNF2 family DNA or RNA helicase
LPGDWLSRWGVLGDVAGAQGETLRFRRNELPLLAAIAENAPELDYDATFERLTDELVNGQAPAPLDPPAGFAGELRGYQREGLGWLCWLERMGLGGCLADDMGLGKTVQVLALLARKRKATTPSLVVAPRSVLFNWANEAARFAPKLRVRTHWGAERAPAADGFGDCDVVLTTYGTLCRDIEALAAQPFRFVVLDEAQAVKNAESRAARSVRLLRAEHRLALSGTPIENHLGELFSLFDFLNPGMLGRAKQLKQAVMKSRLLDASSASLLSRAVKPFVLRRTKGEVARDLPERTEQTLYVELSPKEREKYDELLAYYRASFAKKVETTGPERTTHVLAALLRLRQAACHVGLLDSKRTEESSAKLEVLFAQLEQVFEGGHKALVFSQFTSLLAIVRRELDARGVVYEYLDGKTQDRMARVERFQNDPACRTFLISLKAGGVGLNLTAADYVFILDPWWNPAVEAQAIDRTHRIGQTKRVVAYRLLARGTVEEKVEELKQRKRDLVRAVLGDDAGFGGKLSRDDLELLMS